jgi:head-tail adaptor
MRVGFSRQLLAISGQQATEARRQYMGIRIRPGSELTAIANN